MKAYKISCEDEDHGMLVCFADNGRSLKRANSGNCDCGFIDRHVHRAPEFDKYAPGPMTISQYLAEGWYWPCSTCEQHAYVDRPGLLVVESHDRVFCSRKCAEQVAIDYPGDDWHDSILELKKAALIALKASQP